MINSLENLTLEELLAWIDARIDQKLGTFEDIMRLEDDEPDTRSWEQVKADIEHDRWTPPVDAKSSSELLREDRDR